MKSKSVTINALSTMIEVPQSTLNKQLSCKAALSADTLTALTKQFHDLSAEWLLRGTEPMTISDADSSEQTDEKLRLICIDQLKKIYDLEAELVALKGESLIKHA